MPTPNPEYNPNWQELHYHLCGLNMYKFFFIILLLIFTLTGSAEADERPKEIQMWMDQSETIFASRMREKLSITSSNPIAVAVDARSDGSAVTIKANEVGTSSVEITIANANKKIKFLVKVVGDNVVLEEKLTLKEGESSNVGISFSNDRLPHLEYELSKKDVIEVGKGRPNPIHIMGLNAGETVMTIKQPIRNVTKRLTINVTPLNSSAEAAILQYWILQDQRFWIPKGRRLGNLIENGICINNIFLDDYRSTFGIEDSKGKIRFILHDQIRDTYKWGKIDPGLLEFAKERGFTKQDVSQGLHHNVLSSNNGLWAKLLGCH